MVNLFRPGSIEEPEGFCIKMLPDLLLGSVTIQLREEKNKKKEQSFGPTRDSATEIRIHYFDVVNKDNPGFRATEGQNDT